MNYEEVQTVLSVRKEDLKRAILLRAPKAQAFYVDYAAFVVSQYASNYTTGEHRLDLPERMTRKDLEEIAFAAYLLLPICANKGLDDLAMARIVTHYVEEKLVALCRDKNIVILPETPIIPDFAKQDHIGESCSVSGQELLDDLSHMQKAIGQAAWRLG